MCFAFLNKLTYSATEIQIPQSKIEKLFSSFSDSSKYQFKVGIQSWTGSSNSSIGVNANLYNNMTNNVAFMAGADIRYHVFSFNNKLSNFVKTFDGENFSFDLKTNNVLDFSFKLGFRFKINKTFSLTPYGIIGMSWNRVSIDNNSIKPLQTLNTEQSSFKEAHGFKLMLLDNFLQLINGIKEVYNASIPIDQQEPLEIFFFNSKYEVDSTNGANFIVQSLINDQFFMKYDRIEYNHDTQKFTYVIKENANEPKPPITIENADGFKDILEEKLKASESDFIIIKSMPYDSKAINQLIEPDIREDYITQKPSEYNGKIYEKITKDENGNFTIEYLDEKHVAIPEKVKNESLLNIKYGVGIELGIKNNVYLTLEYRFSRPNVEVLFSTNTQENYKINIHEINFGVGAYLW